jgi:peroxiredoxin
MLADTHRAATEAMGLALDATAALGGVRCRRFSAVIVDGRVAAFNLEPPGEMACSLANAVLPQLRAVGKAAL